MNEKKQTLWDNIKEVMTEGLGFPPSDEMIQYRYDRLDKDLRYNSTSFKSWLGYADPYHLMDLGALQVDGLTAIYREVLGREPDPEGLAFWKGHYEDGMPLSEVIRHIEQSDEAKG